ncbi:unnamed protein product [Mytilus edulis]|uniref:Fucolectin tachylectin-4 pentraxin-1 domain-containing protein n=1 Tax=Mytilus edulis TaxID=6550 RepID=A0A8S3PXL6_MYTED|nr:unnamed protein product [Mytilus edulis]
MVVIADDTMSSPVLNLVMLVMLVELSTLEVAKHKQTKQSTNEHTGRLSSSAVDGNYDQRITDSHEACSHTDIGDEPSWWAVDLGAIYDITERLSNFVIEVFRPCRNKTSWFDDSIVTQCHHQKEKITHLEAACPKQTVGKYVRIRLKDQNYLALCEVEVHGTFVENVYSATVPHTCGFPGHRYDGNVEAVWSAIVNSEVQCTFMCAITNICHAANFNTKTSMCSLMEREIGANVVVKSDHTVFLVN